MKNISTIGFLLVFFSCCLSMSAGATELKTKDLTISLDNRGYYSMISVEGKNILKQAESPFLLALSKGNVISPKSLVKDGDKIKLTMTDGGIIEMKCTESAISIVLEILSLPGSYESILYGPVKLTIHEVVGDVIGVVQGNGIAFGIQGLDMKAVAGIPDGYGDKVLEKFPYKGIQAELSVASISPEKLAAVDTEDGSVIQLFVRRRDKQEYRQVMQLPNAMVLPVEGKDAFIEGAKVAFFGCKDMEALNTIGKIEVEQNLPHPMINGSWAKTSRSSMQSYLISDFSEEDMDFVLDKAHKAGYNYIYHQDPFEQWGHFTWNKKLVKEGTDAAVKRLVDKAKAQGVSVGVHTLTNFITTNDPYVTPKPSGHLLKQGILSLTDNLNATQTEIKIKKSGLFEVPMTLNGLQIEEELIAYGSVETQGDFLILKDCKRGAFGTKAAAHSKNKELYKLWDYPYKTFFPDLKLQDKLADRIVELVNNTGVKQISFDGLEGCAYTGQDDYAVSRFVSQCYAGWQDNLINDASRLSHYLWHIHTRMNWGEPWGEAMRKGQVENRIKNQDFFRRNLFPRMLGWFLIRLQDRNFECTTMEDLEWALSESAGFDAGYAMVINMKTLKQHGQMDKLLEKIKEWDALRLSDAFTNDQKKRLRDPETEWHLEKREEGVYELYPLSISKHYRCNLDELQPGQPGGADWSWSTPYDSPFALRLRVVGDGSIKNPKFSTPKGVIVFPCEIKSGQYLLYGLDGKASVTDKNFNHIQDVQPQGTALLAKGASAVAFSCEPEEDSSVEVEVRHITLGDPEIISKISVTEIK